MYFKTEAIIIGRRPVMNTSLVLRCYTERAGRLTILAKGAERKRRKAEPPSVPDLFQRGELVLWFGARRDSAILREWSLDDPRPGIRSDYGAYEASCACVSMVNELARTGEGQGEYFVELEGALSLLDQGGSPRPIVWGFVLRALDRAGFIASPGACATCGRRFAPGQNAILSPDEGGLTCSRCASRSEARTRRLRLSPEAVSSIRFLHSAPMNSSSSLHVSDTTARSIDAAVRMLAEHHLERSMAILTCSEGRPR